MTHETYCQFCNTLLYIENLKQVFDNPIIKCCFDIEQIIEVDHQLSPR